MAVFDASVLVEYLAGGKRAGLARERLLSDTGSMWVPHLADAEIGHVLRRGVGRGILDGTLAAQALEDLASLPLLRVSHVSLLERAWELRENLSFYDALYVALAEKVAEPLVTLDARMASAPGIGVEIEVLGESLI